MRGSLNDPELVPPRDNTRTSIRLRLVADCGVHRRSFDSGSHMAIGDLNDHHPSSAVSMKRCGTKETGRANYYNHSDFNVAPSGSASAPLCFLSREHERDGSPQGIADPNHRYRYRADRCG